MAGATGVTIGPFLAYCLLQARTDAVDPDRKPPQAGGRENSFTSVFTNAASKN